MCGSAMMFVFPPMMYIKAIQKEAKEQGKSANKAVFAMNVALLMGGLGFWGGGSYFVMKNLTLG